MGLFGGMLEGMQVRSAIDDRRAAREAAYRQGMARLSETQRHNSAVEARMQETADTMKGYRSDQATHMATGDARQAAIEARVAQEKQQGELAKPFDEKFAGSAPEEFTQGRSLSREIPTALDSPSMVFPPFDVSKGQQMPGDVKLGPSPKEDAQSAYDSNLTAFNQKKGAAEAAAAKSKQAIPLHRLGLAEAKMAQPTPKQAETQGKYANTIRLVDSILEDLNDPEVAANTGPVMGRLAEARHAAGSTIGSGKTNLMLDKLKRSLMEQVSAYAGARGMNPAEQAQFKSFHAQGYNASDLLAGRLLELRRAMSESSMSQREAASASGKDMSRFPPLGIGEIPPTGGAAPRGGFSPPAHWKRTN